MEFNNLLLIIIFILFIYTLYYTYSNDFGIFLSIVLLSLVSIYLGIFIKNTLNILRYDISGGINNLKSIGNVFLPTSE
jgi:hypothetical protein